MHRSYSNSFYACMLQLISLHHSGLLVNQLATENLLFLSCGTILLGGGAIAFQLVPTDTACARRCAVVFQRSCNVVFLTVCVIPSASVRDKMAEYLASIFGTEKDK